MAEIFVMSSPSKYLWGKNAHIQGTPMFSETLWQCQLAPSMATAIEPVLILQSLDTADALNNNLYRSCIGLHETAELCCIKKLHGAAGGGHRLCRTRILCSESSSLDRHAKFAQAGHFGQHRQPVFSPMRQYAQAARPDLLQDTGRPSRQCLDLSHAPGVGMERPR